MENTSLLTTLPVEVIVREERRVIFRILKNSWPRAFEIDQSEKVDDKIIDAEIVSSNT